MSRVPRAVLLAAGRGRRLGSDSPKCLIDVEGKTLLARHLEHLAECQVPALTIVVGFQREAIEGALARTRTPVDVELVDNPDFVRGSIVSLHVAMDRLEQGGMWMDADVLYPAPLLRRLIGSAHDNCVLADGGSEESGEEMMIGTRGGRVLKIARRVGRGWDFAGESVGFAKVGPEGAAAMRRIIAEEVTAGRLDQEYEAAMDRAFHEVRFGFERVDDLRWTEIDFQEDVEKARQIARGVG
ncbi:MAG: phosphocholine cytidylyltransferase family protein [Polyangiaceae bacterium]